MSNLKPWAKGVSGNPGGRPKLSPEVRDLARAHTEAAVATLAEVLNDNDAPHAARVAAASTILDRGWGKAPQHLTVAKSPLSDVDAATLAALAEALTAGTRSTPERDEATPLH